MTEVDMDTAVAALTECASVAIEGPSRDRVRLSVGVEGGGEEYFLIFDPIAAKALGYKLVAAAMKALGFEGNVGIVVTNADNLRDRDFELPKQDDEVPPS